MHILLTNDDGPPSNQHSPYIHSLFNALIAAGHIVSVIIPNSQRSWIGKAYLAERTLTTTYFCPGTLHQDDGVVSDKPFDEEKDQWVMIDGTPASCIQIGLYHFFADKGPVDLVLSGPNFGRNTTALFALSSGTLGGAMEGALCGKKSIGISYAYESESEHHNPEWIAAASKLSVKLVEKLVVEWPDEVQLYSINVPLEQSLIGTKIFIADMLQNAWSRRSCFEEVEAREEHEVGPIETEQVVRNNEERTKRNETTKLQHRRFQWAPTFEDIMKSASESEEGSDGRVIHAGYVSVTPLKANFWHLPNIAKGEIKL